MNALYATAKTAFLEGAVSWTNTTVRALLVNSSYVPDLNVHNWLSDIPALSRIGSSIPLVNKTVVGGVANANPANFYNITGTFNAIVLFADSGAESSSQLIAYINTVTGLPLSVTGSSLVLTWDVGENKIFKI